MLPTTVKCVDERSIAAVIVSPKQVWVVSRGCNSAALFDGLVLKVCKVDRRIVGATCSTC